MSASPVIAFFPEASFGAALNCVGIAQALQERGATPVFICHAGFTGVFAEYGFKEYHLPEDRMAVSETAEDYWQDFISTHRPHFNLSPFDQLSTYVAPTWEAIVDTVIEAEEALGALLTQIRPDMILLDNVIMFPAIANANCPWGRIISCAETELPDAWVPPYLSGLPPEDTAGAAAFSAAYIRETRAVHRRYNAFRKARGLSELPDGIFLETSPALNLLLAPEPVRYTRQTPLPPERFTYLEGCVRRESPFEAPEFPDDEGPLVYMSFGSLGATDVALIRRMIGVFATIPARFLVNVGGFLDAYDDIPDNVVLGGWFPQPSVVETASLFIHHGGNNSFCEALYHGVPSLVIPYCWDGHDNAQRARAVAIGDRLDRSALTEDRLRAAILALLEDAEMKARLAVISDRMKRQSGTKAAAGAILSALALSSAMHG